MNLHANIYVRDLRSLRLLLSYLTPLLSHLRPRKWRDHEIHNDIYNPRMISEEVSCVTLVRLRLLPQTSSLLS